MKKIVNLMPCEDLQDFRIAVIRTQMYKRKIESTEVKREFNII